MGSGRLSYSVTVKESTSQLIAAATEAIEKEINVRLKKWEKRLRQHFAPILIDVLKKQPEYESIISGDLREHFGILDAHVKLDKILDTWGSTIKIVSKPVKFSKQSSSGGIKIEAIRSNFADVMGLDAGYQMTEKGTALHWLEWLLLAGDKVIIRDYIIDEVSDMRGRAGKQIMVEWKGGSWSVPLGFRGNEANNWTTRAVDAAEDTFMKLFKGILL